MGVMDASSALDSLYMASILNEKLLEAAAPRPCK
jgi:hypothetical protein